MKNKEREGIVKRFLETIYEISNTEFQERIWIKGLGPECSSFEDVICDFFDNGEDIMNNYKNYGITNKQYKVLLRLSKPLDKYSDEVMTYSANINPEVIIKDKKWKKIQKLAKEVLKVFNYKK